MSTNPFDENKSSAATTAVATAEPEVETGEVEDLDVDVDTGTEEETEVAPEAPPTRGANVKKVGTSGKPTSSRRPVAEGYVAPVQMAKLLSEHLTEKARAAEQIAADEEIEVKPQVMYSYIKNNAEGSKNPLPRYTDPALTGGRECVVKPAEVIAWWDEKDKRVAASKAAAKAKAEKKTEKPTETPAEAESTEAPPVVEAE